MNMRSAMMVTIVSCAALSGCVTYGNTHALITPIGVAGVHSFKPSDNARNIRLPKQSEPDQVAATGGEQQSKDDRS